MRGESHVKNDQKSTGKIHSTSETIRKTRRHSKRERNGRERLQPLSQRKKQVPNTEKRSQLQGIMGTRKVHKKNAQT